YAFLFHGFPDDATSFLPLMEILADNGFTTIAPYMRGYGETERPEPVPENYSIPNLVNDIISVINSFDTQDPLLVGHDWGSIASTSVCTLDPSAVGECVAIAVPPDFMESFENYPTQALRSWYMTMFQIPGFAEETLRRDDFALIERLWRAWSPDWDYSDERIEEVKETFRTGETVEASLQYYRAFFDDFLSQPAGSMEIRGIEVPTLLMAGKNDGCITSAMYEGSGKCYDARYNIEIVNGAGHFVHVEKPDVVGEKILEFIE
ncbi:MAG: alpha/beta hydrolase, partial [Halobacteria archaeon]|nr:alpha/beta hydrolase [Halobacteria archaeon]